MTSFDIENRSDVTQFCRDHLTQHPGATYLDIKKAIQAAHADVGGVPKRKVNSVLYELERDGELRREIASDGIGKPLWFPISS